jgi:ribosomal protein S18 acetylase RimI-like enzyme
MKKELAIIIEIREIVNADDKAKICNEILRSLPNWFGVETSIIEYTNQVQALPFYAAFENNNCVGFVAVKPHNPYTAEICVMGVLQEYHRKGIGSMLINCGEKYCRESKRTF